MKDDPSLHDEQLENEIRLVGDLVLAATQCEGPLSQEAIDEILGLGPPQTSVDGSARTPADGSAQTPADGNGGRDPAR